MEMDNIEIMWGMPTPVSVEPMAKYSTADAGRIIGFACPHCGQDIGERTEKCPQCNCVFDWFIFELAEEMRKATAAQTNISE
jgi:predicted RNA-binding Zn-ribbon protein involved in translation (DUF1610 family)